MNETIFSLAEELGSSQLREIGRKMVEGDRGFTQLDKTRGAEDRYLYYTGLEYGGWALGVLFPKGEMLADVHRLSWIMGLIGLCGFFVLALVIIYIARRITHPLTELSSAALEIASGNLYLKLP